MNHNVNVPFFHFLFISVHFPFIPLSFSFVFLAMGFELPNNLWFRNVHKVKCKKLSPPPPTQPTNQPTLNPQGLITKKDSVT